VERFAVAEWVWDDGCGVRVVSGNAGGWDNGMRVVGGKMVGEDLNRRAGSLVFAAAEAMILGIRLR